MILPVFPPVPPKWKPCQGPKSEQIQPTDDRLLASPRYGEKWVNVARLSSLYVAMNAMAISRKSGATDYVIDSWQISPMTGSFSGIAGDELPDADAASITATGYQASVSGMMSPRIGH